MEKYHYIEQLIERYPAIAPAKEDIKRAADILSECYEKGGKILIAGNGGSAADSEHMVGELMKGFVKPRKVSEEFKQTLLDIDEKNGEVLADCLQQAVPAIALCGHSALSTAYLNDVEGKVGFAQQVMGYATDNDVFFGISTSGNSQNVVYAAITAKAKGIGVIALTGETGGKLKDYADVTIKVPGTEPYKVQEYHLPVYHALCLELEERYF